MNTDSIGTIWNQYAACWSLAPEIRERELAASVTSDVQYQDPNTIINGLSELSEYMEGFRSMSPGSSFRIDTVSGHHDASMARWSLLDAEGRSIGAGASFANEQNGLLKNITGFFESS
ncbi:nuclear transport factor 2 family protein [Arthrobacter sp. SA17]